MLCLLVFLACTAGMNLFGCCWAMPECYACWGCGKDVACESFACEFVPSVAASGGRVLSCFRADASAHEKKVDPITAKNGRSKNLW